MWQYILFDLDGTLIDPMVGITKSVQYALADQGIHVQDLNELCPFIGPPLRDSFQELYGFDDAQADRAAAKYRERFSEKGVFENTLYEGVPQLLETLRGAGKDIVIATSKPTFFAQQILERYGIEGYFSFVSGSEMNGSRSKKADVIRYALENCGVDDAKEAVMIGDRKHDIIGAQETGLDSIGVLWGYGGLDELQRAEAGYIAADIDEMMGLLLRV